MLKVSSPRTQEMPMDVQLNQPPQEMPMDNAMPMVDNATPMDSQMPMDDNDGDNINPYDTNFDAGIDTNEDDDPKRYIQQLTGKLSQSLRKYQQELPTPDSDLDKYVAGMILKQTTDGLDNKDVDEILNKMKDDESQDTNEGIERENSLNELFQELTGNTDDEEGREMKINHDSSYRKSPFIAPKFD